MIVPSRATMQSMRALNVDRILIVISFFCFTCFYDSVLLQHCASSQLQLLPHCLSSVVPKRFMTALWGVFLLLKKQSLFGIQRCRTWGRLCGVVLTGEDIHQTVVLLNGDYRALGIHVNPSVLCRFFHVFMISELKISLFPLSFPLARLAKGHGKADKGNSCEALCLPGLRHAMRARMRTFFRGRSATVRLCVCVCVCVC